MKTLRLLIIAVVMMVASNGYAITEHNLDMLLYYNGGSCPTSQAEYIAQNYESCITEATDYKNAAMEFAAKHPGKEL